MIKRVTQLTALACFTAATALGLIKRYTQFEGKEMGTAIPPLYIACYSKAQWIKDIERGREAYADVFEATYPGSEVNYWGDVPIKDLPESYRYHVTPLLPNDESRDKLVSVLYWSMMDFYTNSTADWFMRIGTDTFINVKTYPLLMKAVAQHGLPRTTPLAFGNIVWANHMPYMQGGAGYLFSRAWVEMMFEHWKDFESLQMETIYDDMMVGKFHAKYSSLNYSNSPYFSGHNFNKNIFKPNFLTQHLDLCPAKPPIYAHTNTQFGKVKNLFSIHSHTDNMIRQASTIKHNLDALPDNVYWYQNGLFPKICIRPKHSNPQYYSS